MANNKKIVLVSGHFNVLHPGHLRLLRFAKEYGGRLLVAVESDSMAGSAAHVPENLRLEGVKCNSWVDEAFLLDEPIQELINRLRPDIVVKGKEHESQHNIESEILESYGGKLIFSSGESIFSSLDLIRKEFRDSKGEIINLPIDYMNRHKISKKKLTTLIAKFADLKVCVVGDLIIDEYITCQALGMSQEDPTIVVTPVDSTMFVGGSGIVAAHASSMGATVYLVSVAGDDEACDFAKNALIGFRVDANLFIDVSRPTTLKKRFRSGGKSLLRVSYLHQAAIAGELQNQIFNKVLAILDEVDILVFSDFNYGCLPQPLVDKIISAALKKGVFMVADSQSSSQIGDVGRFRGMSLITPTEREARISTRNHEDGLVILAEKLRMQSSAKNILLKLGGEGLLIHSEAGIKSGSWLTDRVEALNSAPKDVAGAGDSLLIAAAMSLAVGGDIWEAACLGSIAASIQVGRVGNSPIQQAEMLREIN